VSIKAGPLSFLLPLLAFLSVVLFHPQAVAEDKNVSDFDRSKMEGPLSITADYIRHYRKENRAEAKGNVALEYKDTLLTGDECEIDSNTGLGIMRGNARIQTEEILLGGSKFEFFLNSSLGTMENMTGYTRDGFYFTSKKAVRIKEDQYRLTKGTLTTCDPENPDWVAKSGRVELTLEDFATFYNMSFYFKGIPVFYTPYWAVPSITKRTTGFLEPSFGWSSRDGDYLNLTYFIAVSDQDDITLYLDYLSNRGTREGFEYRYFFAKNTYGKFNFDYADDRIADKSLWKLDYTHRHKSKSALYSRVKLDEESEVSYSKVFNDDDTALRSKKYTDSFIEFSYLFPGSSASMFARSYKDMGDLYPLNKNFYSKKPEISANIYPRRLFNTPLIAGIQNTITNLETETVGPNPVDIKNTSRLDVRPMLSLPLVPFNGFNFMPWVNGIGTWYSHNKIDESPLYVSYYTAGAAMEIPKAYKIFRLGDQDLKHTLTPIISYQYIPGYEVDDERLKVPLIDHLEQSTPISLLNFSLENSVLQKSAGNTLGQEIIRLNITQGYDFREANRITVGEKDKNKPLSNLNLDLDSKPLPWMVLNTALSYNHYENKPDSTITEAGIALKNGFFISYQKTINRLPEAVFSSGIMGVSVERGWSAEISTIYDEINYENPSTMLDITYKSCCFTVDVAAQKYYRTRVLEDNTYERYLDTKFFLLFSFKGFGDTGNKVAPIVGRKI